MKIYKLLFITLLSSTSVFASFEGEYQKKTGPDLCPEGRLYFKELKADKQKYLIFGVKHSWVFDINPKVSDLSEQGDESSCSYDYTYSLKTNDLNYKTKRSKCPTVDENAAIEEDFKLVGRSFTYSFKSLSEDKKFESFECVYQKIK